MQNDIANLKEMAAQSQQDPSPKNKARVYNQTKKVLEELKNIPDKSAEMQELEAILENGIQGEKNLASLRKTKQILGWTGKFLSLALVFSGVNVYLRREEISTGLTDLESKTYGAGEELQAGDSLWSRLSIPSKYDNFKYGAGAGFVGSFLFLLGASVVTSSYEKRKLDCSGITTLWGKDGRGDLHAGVMVNTSAIVAFFRSKDNKQPQPLSLPPSNNPLRIENSR